MGLEALAMTGFSAGLGALDNAAKGDKAPKGGGIPGLTHSTGSGKDGTEGSVVQVDPTIALDYFKKASKTQESGYKDALSYYGPALQKAGNAITQGFQKANTTLMPLSYASNQALNEQMRMMGLDPIQATASYGTALRTGLQMIGDDKDVGAYGEQLAQMMDNAANIRDPGERAYAKENIQKFINQAKGKLIDPIQAQMGGLTSNIARRDQSGTAQYYANTLANNPNEDSYGNRANMQGQLDGYNSALDAEQRYKQGVDIESQKGPLAEKMQKRYEYLNELNSMGADWASKYSDEYDGGYSAEQIRDKIAQTPGYQFQLEQGSKGIERKAAATGMVNSANTQAALQEFGQNQAMSYYNNYLQQLSGITAQGAGATMQISANEAAQGSALGQLAQVYGQAQMDTYRKIADYGAQSLAEQGTMFNETAKFNASMQFNSAENAKKAASAAALGAPNMMNAQTNAGQLGLAQAQFQQQLIGSQSYGQGYLTGIGGGGANYSAPQQNWSSLQQYLGGRAV